MAEREIFSVCGKTVYMRRTKNGKPVGTPRAKPAIMTLSLMKPCPHRHFEQSEKSFSFAVKRCICEERKTGNPSSGNLRAKPAIMTLSLMKPRPHTVISSGARNLFRMW